MTGHELFAALARMPDECLARPVVVDAGTGAPDAPVFAVTTMTGPDAGVLLLTTEPDDEAILAALRDPQHREAVDEIHRRVFHYDPAEHRAQERGEREP